MVLLVLLGLSQRGVAQCYSSYTAAPGTICSGQTATLTTTNLTGVSPFTTQWFNSTGQLVGVGQTINVAPTATTFYTGTTTDANNCIVNGAPVWVTVNTSPTAIITTTMINNNTGVLLTASGGTPLWTNGAITPTLTLTQSSQSGLYGLIVTANGCQGTSNPVAVVITSCGTATPPVANFVANQTNGCGPLTVEFTNTTTGTAPLTHLWSFPGGNPSTSTAQNPTVTYMTAGVYNVMLTATNGAGTDSEVKTGFIVVSAQPTASFTTAISGLTTTFTNTSTGATSFFWNFGDGNTSTAANPSHTYACDGNYTVTLTVTGPCGSAMVSQVVGINTAPLGDHIFAHHNNSTPEGLSAWVCQGDTLFLTATQGTMQTCLYSWSPSGVGKTIKFIASGPNASIGSYPIQCNVLVAATGVTTTYTFTVNVVNCVSGTQDGEKVKAPTMEFGKNINLFPNPTSGDVTFSYDFPTPTQLSVHIVDMLGQIVFQNDFGVVVEGTEQLELADLPAGIYTLVFGNGTATCTKKIVKQ